MRSVFIHQPHFLPWLPYISRIIKADCVVYLDNVKYKKQYFHNRVKLRRKEGHYFWLTLPVCFNDKSSISDVMISPEADLQKLCRRTKEAYREHQRSNEIINLIFDILQQSRDYSLSVVNVSLINATMELLGFPRRPFHFASSFSRSQDATVRLIEIANAIRASTLICGWGGTLTTHRLNDIAMEGINFCKQDKDIVIPLLPDPTPGLSTIHSLISYGPEKCRSIIDNLIASSFTDQA